MHHVKITEWHEMRVLKGLGWSIAEIARRTGRHRHTVRTACAARRFCRKQRALSPRISKRRALVKKLSAIVVTRNGRRRKRFGSALAIASELNPHGIKCSSKTVVRDLKALGKVRRVRPFVTTTDPAEVKQRKEFARKMLRTTQQWRDRIVFSDETWLTTNDLSSRWEWVEEGQKPLVREKKSKWNTYSVQCWAAIGKNYRSKLVIFPTHQTTADNEKKAFRMNSTEYIRRCLSVVQKDLVEQRKIFQFDGARAHVSKQTRAYLAKKGVTVLEGFPPYSADMNMIEPLWAYLKRKVAERSPNTLAELKVVAQEEWESIPHSVLTAHCRGFRNRCVKVSS